MLWPLFIPVLIIIGVVWAVMGYIAPTLLRQRRERTQRLQKEYGETYFQAVEDLGNEAGERALEEREEDERKVGRPLSDQDAQRFRETWSAIQGRFEQTPDAAVMEADALITDLLRVRGIDPAHDTAGLHSVEHYRNAHAVADALRTGGRETPYADIERALHQYRLVFDELA